MSHMACRHRTCVPVVAVAGVYAPSLAAEEEAKLWRRCVAGLAPPALACMSQYDVVINVVVSHVSTDLNHIAMRQQPYSNHLRQAPGGRGAGSTLSISAPWFASTKASFKCV